MSLMYKNIDKENKNKLKSGIYVSSNAFIGATMKYAITCRTYPLIPKNLNKLFEDMTNLYKNEFEKFTDDFYLKVFETPTHLYEWLKEKLMRLDSVNYLNLSLYELENNITVNGERLRCENDFKNDFVDIWAYIRNVQHDLIINNIDFHYADIIEKLGGKQ